MLIRVSGELPEASGPAMWKVLEAEPPPVVEPRYCPRRGGNHEATCGSLRAVSLSARAREREAGGRVRQVDDLVGVYDRHGSLVDVT